MYKKVGDRKVIASCITSNNIVNTENSNNTCIITDDKTCINNNIDLSIIIPVYNSEKYLDKCISSILSQNKKNIEIICVDDGSTDTSWDILCKYRDIDPRVVIFRQENLHAGMARNKGLTVARGRYVHFLDSDDWVRRTGYEELWYDIIRHEPDIIKFSNYAFDESTKKIIDDKWVNIGVDSKHMNKKHSLKNSLHFMLYSIPDNPWSGIYKLSFLKQNNIIFDDLLCANDTSFYIRCILNASYVFLSSKKVIYHRKEVENSLMKRRIHHFECQLAQYYIVSDIVKETDEKIKNAVLVRILDNIINFYKRFIVASVDDMLLHKKIIRQTRKFFKSIDKNVIKNIKKQDYPIVVNNILRPFSIRNNFTVGNFYINECFVFGILYKRIFKDCNCESITRICGLYKSDKKRLNKMS